MAETDPQLVSPDYFNRPELERWQRDLLDAFYVLARARQNGLDINPIQLVEMEAMTRLNPIVSFYDPMDLVEIWQALDGSMRDYWEEKRQEKAKRELEKAERAKAQAASP